MSLCNYKVALQNNKGKTGIRVNGNMLECSQFTLSLPTMANVLNKKIKQEEKSKMSGFQN